MSATLFAQLPCALVYDHASFGLNDPLSELSLRTFFMDVDSSLCLRSSVLLVC